jgi:hypothetical protein
MEQEEAQATETERIEDTDPEQKVKVGDFVAVVYDAKWFLGKIEEIDREENDCEINFLTNAKHMFRWPTTPDLLWVDQTHILCKVKSLVPSGKSARLYKVNSDEKDAIKEKYAHFLANK